VFYCSCQNFNYSEEYFILSGFQLLRGAFSSLFVFYVFSCNYHLHFSKKTSTSNNESTEGQESKLNKHDMKVLPELWDFWGAHSSENSFECPFEILKIYAKGPFCNAPIFSYCCINSWLQLSQWPSALSDEMLMLAMRSICLKDFFDTF